MDVFLEGLPRFAACVKSSGLLTNALSVGPTDDDAAKTKLKGATDPMIGPFDADVPDVVGVRSPC